MMPGAILGFITLSSEQREIQTSTRLTTLEMTEKEVLQKLGRLKTLLISEISGVFALEWRELMDGTLIL